jgi:hypothetical protein
MANPTTNFGWQMPTSTDLVTDLPADFEVFGQAVDTALVDLKGGTTGQVLSKTTDTDMDFTWVDTDDANAIQNAIVDAKGDLIAASAADTPARLAVGNNGETLVADSSATTGLRYSPTPSASNPVLNSAFQIWQRGTSISMASATYTADRWYSQAATNGTVSRQVTNDTTNLPNIQYCARVQRTASQTTVTDYAINQNFESVNSIPFAGKTVTLSFYARKGADFSATSSILKVALASGTGTDQNLTAGGFTGQATPINVNTTLTTTWQRFTYTGTVASTATQLAINYYFTSVGTAGAADYFEVTGVQIDIGSVALPFRTYAATIQGELSACQRYYETNLNPGVFFATFTSASAYVQGVNLAAAGTASLGGTIYFKVTKRSAPTINIKSAYSATANKVSRFSDAADIGTTVTAGWIGQNNFSSINDSGSGFTANTQYYFTYEAVSEL